MTLTEEYKNKLEGILLIKTIKQASDAIGCCPRVLSKWKNNPGMMQLKYAESINRVFNENQSLIHNIKKQIKGE